MSNISAVIAQAQSEYKRSRDITRFLDAYRTEEQFEEEIYGLMLRPDPRADEINKLLKEILGED